MSISDANSSAFAGNKEKFNTMTASWGGDGVLWQENVVTTDISCIMKKGL
jgi:hypothetical protein